jgi:hypothetical protein
MSTYSILRNANVETVEKQGNLKTDKILSTLLWKSACSDTHYTYIIPSHHTKYKQKSYIVAISFIDGGNRSTGRKPPTCRQSLLFLFFYIIMH